MLYVMATSAEMFTCVLISVWLIINLQMVIACGHKIEAGTLIYVPVDMNTLSQSPESIFLTLVQNTYSTHIVVCSFWVLGKLHSIHRFTFL